jgi:hypothetical protein
MELKLPSIVFQSGGEFAGPMNATPIDDHHDVFPGVAKDVHDLMEILAKFLRIKMGHDLIEDAGGTVLHGADDREQHAARDAAPGAVTQPGLAFEGLVTVDLALAQRPCGEARTLGAAPPARPEHGKAPEDRLIFIEQNDLAPTGTILQGGEFEMAKGESRRIRIKAPGGATRAQRVFFNTPRTLSRPSWTPVCWANTIANSRQLH